VLETERVANVTNQILVILAWPFFATSNALINCRNGMMGLFFSSMTLEFNMFNLQRQPSKFDDIETFIFIWVEEFTFDDEFTDMFAAE